MENKKEDIIQLSEEEIAEVFREANRILSELFQSEELV
ncbi:MAG: hypothetical protein K0Q75_2012 [Anaerospora sp.]|jgi:hypothetical protein|nr:hypothetical protein [Anaerospora sp.]